MRQLGLFSFALLICGTSAVSVQGQICGPIYQVQPRTVYERQLEQRLRVVYDTVYEDREVVTLHDGGQVHSVGWQCRQIPYKVHETPVWRGFDVNVAHRIRCLAIAVFVRYVSTDTYGVHTGSLRNVQPCRVLRTQDSKCSHYLLGGHDDHLGTSPIALCV